MVVWNSMLLKIIIIPLGVVKQHVRFIVYEFYFFILLPHHHPRKAPRTGG